MTFSIVGCSPDTCQTGVAIASSLMAITSRCAFVRGSIGAVVVQGFSDPRLGPQALELLASGYAPDAVIRALERSEECFEYRQLAVINLHGHTAVHAGSRAPGLCATATGANCAAAGNRLEDAAIPQRMVEAFAAATGELADRLLAALRAGVEAGGQTVPVRAAGVVVAERDPWPLIDLRIDWSDADPVDELSRLWHLWRPQMRDFLVRALDPATAAAAAAAAQAPEPR